MLEATVPGASQSADAGSEPSSSMTSLTSAEVSK
jgi:hypothetical protein